MNKSMFECSLTQMNARHRRRNELAIRHWLMKQQELCSSREVLHSLRTPSQRSSSSKMVHRSWRSRWFLAWTCWRIRLLQRLQRWLYQAIEVLERHIQHGCARHLELQYAERCRERLMREAMEYSS